MENETAGKCPQNTHNGPDDGLKVNSEDCEEGSRRIEILFSELQAVGVTLFIEDGRLAFDAPDGAMTDELLARVRAERDGLLALLTGEQAAAPEPSGVSCPFCRSERLEDVEPGWRCSECKRLAWVWTAGGSIVRADCERMNLKWPTCQSDSTNSWE